MANKPTYEELEQRVKELEDETFEHKRAEKVLKENELKLRVSEQELNSILHHSPDIIYRLNPAGEITYINDIVKEYGYSREDLIGKNILEFVHPDDREKAVHRINERRTDDRSTKSLEIRLLRKDLDCVPFEDKSRGFGDFSIDAEGIYSSEKQEMKSFVGTQGIARDITERKQAEEALQEGEERQRSLIEAVSRAGILLFVVDNEYKVRYMNEPMIAGFGDATGSICYLEVGGLDSPCEYCQVSKVIGDGERVHYQPTVADGRTFDIMAVPYTDIDGTRCKLEIIQDVTSQMQAQETLRESERKYRSTVENISDGFFTLTGEDLIITYFNFAAEELLGRKAKDILGKPLFEAFPEAKGSVFENKYRQAYQTKSFFSFETYFGVKPYTNWYDVRVYPGDQSISIFFQVTTERKQAEEQIKGQARLLDLIFEHSLDSIVLLDKDYNFIRVSETYAKACQRKSSEFPGHNHFEFYPSDLKDEVDEAKKGKYIYKKTARAFVFPDHPEWGTTYWNLGLVPILDKEGQIELFLFTLKDVTEQVQADEALRESEEKYRELVQNTNSAILRVNAEGRVTFFNKYAQGLFGYSEEEIIGQYAIGSIVPEVDSSGQDLVGKINDLPKHPERYYNTVNENVCKDGTRVWMSWTNNAVFDEKGNTLELLCIGNDISSLKKAEDALLKEKDFTENLIDTAQVIIVVLDTEGRIVRFNPFMGNISGYKLDEVRGTDWFTTFLPEQDYDQARAIFQRAVINISTHGNINSIVAKDGREIIVEWYDKTLKDADGKTIGLLCIGQDITDRKQTEEALRESEERYRTVADFAHDWEYWVAPDGRYLYVSPSCERITGYRSEDFVNDPGLFEKIVHPDDHSDIVNHLGGERNLEKLPSCEFRIITRSGEERWINHVCQVVYGTNGVYLGRRGSNRDITKQKKMQEELLKAKKLESVGVLAGGIAHDFNNLMSVVVGNISLAKTEMRPGSKGFKNLVEAEKASIQTTALTSRLITFSKGGGPVKEPVSIGDLVKNSVDSSLKGSDISCIFSVPEDILPVEVDEEQMKQVIHNITTNAQEAMAEQGTINVSCGNVIIGEKDTLNLKEDKYGE